MATTEGRIISSNDHRNNHNHCKEQMSKLPKYLPVLAVPRTAALTLLSGACGIDSGSKRSLREHTAAGRQGAVPPFFLCRSHAAGTAVSSDGHRQGEQHFQSVLDSSTHKAAQSHDDAWHNPVVDPWGVLGSNLTSDSRSC